MITPNDPVYLDTSALVWMAELDVAKPSSDALRVGGPVASLLASPVPPVALSSLTIVEFYNTIAAMWRDTEPNRAVYDQEWVDRSQIKVMEMLANGRLVLRSSPARAAEHALALITLATREYGNSLRVWDAIHLIIAASWSHELKQPIQLWTVDKGFDKFVNLFPEFGQFVHIQYLGD